MGPTMPVSLKQWGQDRNVKYFLVTFVDLFGVARSKLVPTEAIDEICEDGGAGFAGFACNLDMSPADGDMLALPDPSSAMQLPWQAELAWVAGDLMVDGKPLEQAPRYILKKVIAEAAEKGIKMKSGVECEMFLLHPTEHKPGDSADTKEKPCYDQGALMRMYDCVREMMDSMLKLGWKPYQADHEDGNGQFELNWTYDDCLATADRHVLFKFLAKSIAQKHGYRATFMPKPFLDKTGTGCHLHISCWSLDDSTNVFLPASGTKALASGFSELGHNFLGGVLAHCSSMVAISNPTINSFKRLGSTATASGATWSPRTVTYGGNNRTHMIRIPAANRFEFRLADGAVNPYLLPAIVLAAGLDGIDRKLDAGAPKEYNAYITPPPPGVEILPSSLLDSIKKLEDADEGLIKRLGAGFVKSYVAMRRREWDEFMSRITDWEVAHTVDC